MEQASRQERGLIHAHSFKKAVSNIETAFLLPAFLYAMMMVMMLFRLAFSALIFLIAAPVPAAFAIGEIPRDSGYFMLDDGEQSPEEMELEAQYVHGLCTSNGFQSTYFDCSCIAGAFLIEREKLGPMVLQQEILHELYKGDNAKCANTAVIAGQVYQNCKRYVEAMRELATDNEQLCTCAANKASNDFGRSPRLSVDYIRNVRQRAMQYCLNPRNRAYNGLYSTTEPR